jgi:hypothetical protein
LTAIVIERSADREASLLLRTTGGGVAIVSGWLESLKTPSFEGRAAFGCPDSAEKQGLATTKTV